jgi:two-component system response regulator RegA
MPNETPNILLVEDDDVFARVMSRALGQRGFTVAIAHDAATASSLITDDIFAYAILDLNLGGHTSLGLIAKLKQSNPSIKILILTGYASIATAVEAIKLGADNYLAKPADAMPMPMPMPMPMKF